MSLIPWYGWVCIGFSLGICAGLGTLYIVGRFAMNRESLSGKDGQRRG